METGISEDEAIKIATRALGADVQFVGESAPSAELVNDTYIVTFPARQSSGLRTGDFLAKIFVDRRTGAVIRKELSA